MAKKTNEEKESKEVIVKEEAGLPAVVSFEEDMGAGFEHTTSKDFKIPIVRVLQALSPEIDEDNPKYVDGAKQGSIYNISTKIAYDGKDGIWVVPVTYFRKFVEFVPRDSGGGYVDEYPIDHPIVKQAKKKTKGSGFIAPNGNELSETGYVPCVHILGDGNYDHIVILAASSGWDFLRDWLGVMRSRVMAGKAGQRFTPAFFSHKYRIVSETKKNTQYSWKGFKIEEFKQLDPVEDSELYLAAKEFNRQMNLEFKTTKMGSVREDSTDNNDSGMGDEDTPF